MDWKTEQAIDGREVTFARYDTQYGKGTGIEYLAKMNEDGSFDIQTHERHWQKVPFMGEFALYRDADEFADYIADKYSGEFPYVVHVENNAPEAYILYIDKVSSIYIRTK